MVVHEDSLLNDEVEMNEHGDGMNERENETSDDDDDDDDEVCIQISFFIIVQMKILQRDSIFSVPFTGFWIVVTLYTLNF